MHLIVSSHSRERGLRACPEQSRTGEGDICGEKQTNFKKFGVSEKIISIFAVFLLFLHQKENTSLMAGAKK